MKKGHWLLLAAAALVAPALRVVQLRCGFDENGLAIPGTWSAWALAAVLAAAALGFLLLARALPGQNENTGGLGQIFLFRSAAGAALGVCGAFGWCAAAVLTFLASSRSLLDMLLAAFSVASAAAVLYVIAALRRGAQTQGVALLIPVCCLMMQLIVLYRADAADPVLARIYIEILALAALTFSAVQRAVFSFHNGSPRASMPIAALGVILALCAAADRKSVASTAFFLSLALVELAFLSAARWDGANEGEKAEEG